MAGDRTVGVAVDFSDCSKKALRWAVENLVRDGDHLILLHVQKQINYDLGETLLWEATGSPWTLQNSVSDRAGYLTDTPEHITILYLSPLIPLSEFSDPGIQKKYGVKPDVETLDILNTVARQKEIIVAMKIYWGDAREKLLEAVDNIPFSCLVVGNRGLGTIKRVILGSVSNYLVNNAACPVTVVKSEGPED